MAGILQYLFTAAKIFQRGSLRKIIREDLEMTLEEFAQVFEKYKGH